VKVIDTLKTAWGRVQGNIFPHSFLHKKGILGFMWTTELWQQCYPDSNGVIASIHVARIKVPMAWVDGNIVVKCLVKQIISCELSLKVMEVFIP
jgi:hypothetical protein